MALQGKIVVGNDPCELHTLLDYISELVIVEAHDVIPILFNPLKPEYIIVIFIHYKPRIAVAILDL